MFTTIPINNSFNSTTIQPIQQQQQQQQSFNNINNNIINSSTQTQNPAQTVDIAKLEYLLLKNDIKKDTKLAELPSEFLDLFQNTRNKIATQYTLIENIHNNESYIHEHLGTNNLHFNLKKDTTDLGTLEKKISDIQLSLSVFNYKLSEDDIKVTKLKQKSTLTKEKVKKLKVLVEDQIFYKNHNVKWKREDSGLSLGLGGGNRMLSRLGQNDIGVNYYLRNKQINKNSDKLSPVFKKGMKLNNNLLVDLKDKLDTNDSLIEALCVDLDGDMEYRSILNVFDIKIFRQMKLKFIEDIVCISNLTSKFKEQQEIRENKLQKLSNGRKHSLKFNNLLTIENQWLRESNRKKINDDKLNLFQVALEETPLTQEEIIKLRNLIVDHFIKLGY